MTLTRKSLVTSLTMVVTLVLGAGVASAASIALNGPPDNATFTAPASVTFSGTRSTGDCTLTQTQQTFGLYLQFPGAATFDIFAMNISDEQTISKTLPISQPGVYHWKGAATCNPSDGGKPSVESETRTLNIVAAAAPDTTAPALTTSAKSSTLHGSGFAFSITSSESATGTVAGSIGIPKGKKVKFTTAPVTLSAGSPTKITLKPAKSKLKAVKQALRHHTLKASVTLSVKDAAGNSTVKKLTLKLKR